MTVRTDIDVDWELSPRLVTVLAPSIEVTIQDLHDTLASLEQNPLNMDDLQIVSSAGKEELGGGVQVGITTTLLDAQLGFEARSVPQDTGTATSTGTQILIDTTGLFETNGVLRGAQVINYTDGSIGTVTNVDSETQVTHTALQGGVANDWTIGDSYSLLNETRCEISGGNLVAVDSVGADLDPIFPTVGTFVVRTSSSSATLQNQQALEASSFVGKEGLGVAFDVINGDDSASLPGRRETPVKTETKVLSVAVSRGLRNIYAINSATIVQDYSKGYVWFGDNPQTVAVTLDNACNVMGNKFQDCYVTGKLDSSNIIWECIVGPITNANGFIYKSTIQGPITVLDDISINKCWVAPNVVGQVITIDFNSVAKAVLISQWEQGRILVKNMVASSQLRVSGTGGFLTIDPSCTAGDVTIDGAVTAVNNGTPDSYVDISTSASVWTEPKAVPLGKHIALE